MNNNHMTGAVFGIAVFVAACVLAGQFLPDPISVPWSVFVRGALFAVGLGAGLVVLVAAVIWFST